MKFLVTIFRDEDETFIAECPSIPGCVGQGKTEEAVKECLEVRAERGMPLRVTPREAGVRV